MRQEIRKNQIPEYGLALAQGVSVLGYRAEDEYKPILAIQSGRPGQTPYFCIPGSGANVVDFLPFASALGLQCCVYGLQARGMSGDFVPHGSVELAARCYADEIDRLYPVGAVHVVGHSFGGWIAYELAVRLRQRGREIASLTIFDSEAPTLSTRVGYEYTRPQALMLLVSLYEQAAEQAIGLVREDFEGISFGAQLSILHKQLVRLNLLPKRSMPEHLRGTVHSFEVNLRVKYKPTEAFCGRVRLVLARQHGESTDAMELRTKNTVLGWRLHAPQLELHIGDGNHVTMLKMPHITNSVNWLLGRHGDAPQGGGAARFGADGKSP